MRRHILYTYLREALTARFIPKGIPEPQIVIRAEIQTLTLFLYKFNADEERPEAHRSNAIMKPIKLLTLTWLIVIGLLLCPLSRADIKVPCLKFSGNAETELSIDLAKLNRITFGDNSMIISSSMENGEQSVELLYSLYHHMEIGDAFPTAGGAGNDELDAAYSNSRMYVDTQAKFLYIQSPSEDKFSIGVFNISGQLLLNSELNDGDAVTLESLIPGSYIAVASDGKIKLNLKFILK